MSGTRGRFLLHEGWSNIRSRPALSAMVALLVVIAASTVTLVEFSDTHGARARGADLVRQGYATLILSPDENIRPRLTAADCQTLGEMQGVIASTWTRQRGESAAIWNTSGPTLPVTSAGAEVVTIIGQGTAGPWSGEQVFIDRGSPLAEGSSRSFSVRIVESSVSFEEFSTVRPADLGVLGQSARGQLVQVSPPDTQQVSSCTALVALPYRETLFPTVNGAFSAAEGYRTQWALPNADAVSDPISTYVERPSRFLPLVMAGALLVVVGLYLRLRQVDHAFYRVAGLRGTRLALLLMLETSVLVGSGLGLTLAVAIVASVWHQPDSVAMAAAWSAFGRFATALAGMALAAAWFQAASLGSSALASLRDR